MKKLLISASFFLCCGTLFAQTTDSVSTTTNRVNSDTTPMRSNSNNPTDTTRMNTWEKSNVNNNSNMNTDSSKMTSSMSHDSTYQNNGSNINQSNNNMNSNSNMSNTSNMNMHSDSATTNAGKNNSNMNSSQSMANNMNNSSMGTSKLQNPMNTPGQPGYAALPLLEDYVPDDVVSKLKSQFGNQLYSITTVKESPTENAYVVWKNNDGTINAQTVNADGSPATPAASPSNQ